MHRSGLVDGQRADVATLQAQVRDLLASLAELSQRHEVGALADGSGAPVVSRTALADCGHSCRRGWAFTCTHDALAIKRAMAELQRDHVRATQQLLRESADREQLLRSQHIQEVSQVGVKVRARVRRPG